MICTGLSVYYFIFPVKTKLTFNLKVDYNELVRKAFKTIQKSKSLDPKFKVPKESLLRFMCDFSE